DVLGAGGTGGEPRRLGGHLQAADGASGGGLGDRRDDRLARELRRTDLLGAERLQLRLLLTVGRSIHARVGAAAELLDQLGVQRAGGAAGDGEDLRGQQREDDPVLVRGPHGAVAAQERGTGALLAAETHGGV